MSILYLPTLYDTYTVCLLLLAGDMTGRYSVYTIYEGHEIMFHVSTLLPYSKENRQQVSPPFVFYVWSTTANVFSTRNSNFSFRNYCIISR